MKKLLNVIIILCILASLVIYEEVLVNSALGKMKISTIRIETLTQDLEHINTAQILTEVEHLESIWEQIEALLCFFINHKDMQDLGVELSRLKATVSVDQREDFKASLQLIIFYVDNYNHIMGFSFQNLF